MDENKYIPIEYIEDCIENLNQAINKLEHDPQKINSRKINHGISILKALINDWQNHHDEWKNQKTKR